ncbi:hypothetical protein LTR09_010757 [Extremus antarcticus]|uniref:N-acetyltransferase domain-containing protein n=1 Tax=Extremus antarcticus TaxID=702011 RepID=A0AAJ0DDS2_9PEZI|nr:hypothetical protein LTR09_010757 [Extremus antarcticus]
MSNPWRSERLIYRSIEVEDEPFISLISNDAEAFMNGAPVIPTPQGKKSATQSREWFATQLVSTIICLPPPVSDPSAIGTDDAAAKPIPIGWIVLMADDPRFVHHRKSEIGINIVKPYQGQGIEIGGFGYNTGALRLYEKLGFKMEGRKRDFFWHDGAYWDLVGLSMLEEEWRELYGKQ